MPDLTVYEKRTCTTCRQLAELLAERGVDFDRVEYHVEGLPEPKLRELLAKAGAGPRDVLRAREPPAAEPDPVRNPPPPTQPRPRMVGTGRACRALTAVRLREPERVEDAFRALQHAWFTTPLVLDEDAGIAEALEQLAGLDVAGILDALGDPEVEERYQAD